LVAGNLSNRKDETSEDNMESLAFIHTAVSYEDSTPDRELKVLENLNVPAPALMGIAGVAVAATVMGGTPNQAMAATAPVGPGSSGQEVQAIQKALRIQADGQYGTKTETAVLDFQVRQGLKEMNGAVGKETAKAMGLDEQYRPIGYVNTPCDVGLNIRSGPGVGYWIIGGGPEGAFLEQDYETVVWNDGYRWTPLYTGGWVASEYTDECGDDCYHPVSYHDDCDDDCGGYRHVAYREHDRDDCDDDCGGYRRVAYRYRDYDDDCDEGYYRHVSYREDDCDDGPYYFGDCDCDGGYGGHGHGHHGHGHHGGHHGRYT
jgi:hypothetical protein